MDDITMGKRHGSVRASLVFAILIATLHAGAAEVKDLRLVPFPKEISATEGDFDLSCPLMLHAPVESAQLICDLLALELQRAGLKAPSVTPSVNTACVVTLTVADPGVDLTHADREALNAKSPLREKAKEEEYALVVDKARIRCESADIKGLLHGVQTLCQLIRANRTEQTIPCLSIRDWPSLKWRGFQNDMTRGPSAKLETLNPSSGSMYLRRKLRPVSQTGIDQSHYLFAAKLSPLSSVLWTDRVVISGRRSDHSAVETQPTAAGD